MRITGLLIVLLILILLFAAPAASYAQALTGSDAAKPAEKVPAVQSFDPALADLVRHARSGSEIERDGVCYTMRTYVMAREDKDSDATRMVRATRCLPAWKLEYKTAVAPVPRNQDDNPAKR